MMQAPGQQPAQQPGGTGSASAPRPMMGAAAQGMTMVRVAMDALQKALPGLPMGSDIHSAVLKAITDIARRMDGGNDDQSSQTQALAQMARENQSNPMAAAMQRMQGGQPGQPASPMMGGGPQQ